MNLTAYKEKLISPIVNMGWVSKDNTLMLIAEIERMRELVKFAHNKAYILHNTKNAVSKNCRIDCKKLFDALEKEIESYI